jgi:hypothetical protein
MNVLDLMTRLNGQILGHKIRATINDDIVVLAKLNDQTWEYTDKGQVLANEHSNLAAQEAAAVAEAAAVKTRKKSVPAVESVSEAVGLRVDIDVSKE